jgi:hypothetical protein|eukprot:COSAG01_NODE_2927_length_6839_cov_3.199407_2_plen_244_part_00
MHTRQQHATSNQRHPPAVRSLQYMWGSAGAPAAFRARAPVCCMPPDGMSSMFCSAEQKIGAIEAIDMHGHYGPTGELLLRSRREAIPADFTSLGSDMPDEPGVRIGGQSPLHQAWMLGGDASTVVSRARQANIGLTVVSPLRGLMPRGRWGEGGCDAFAGNEECAQVVQAPGNEELLQWCIINPIDPRTYEQADAMLRSPKCAGLKFHPEEHCYTLDECVPPLPPHHCSSSFPVAAAATNMFR